MLVLTQEPFGAFTLGDVGWMNEHTQQQAIGVNQNMPFASVHFFSGVIPTVATCFCGFDALTINHCDAWLTLTPELLAYILAQAIVDTLPCLIVTPFVEIVAHR